MSVDGRSDEKPVDIQVGNADLQSAENSEIKRLLIKQLGSQDGQIAFRAMIELDKQGWILDGSLRGANLQAANLYEAMLDGAD